MAMICFLGRLQAHTQEMGINASDSHTAGNPVQVQETGFLRPLPSHVRPPRKRLELCSANSFSPSSQSRKVSSWERTEELER